MAGCVLGLVILAACRGAPTPTSGSTRPAPTTTAPAVPTAAIAPTAAAPPTSLPLPTPEPRAFTIGLAGEPDSLDPANAVTEWALLITRHMYEGLTRFEPGSARAAPALAESWLVSSDGLTWTFRLRPGVRFHDGTLLTAEVARQNFERWLNHTPPGDYAFWRLMFGGFAGQTDETGQPLALITGVTAEGDNTLVITLRRPGASLPNTLAMPSFAMVSPAAYLTGSFGLPGQTSAGAGPFTLQHWGPGIVTLQRNSGYWGAPPTADELIFKVVPDDTQRLLALQTGEIEGMAQVNPAHYGIIRDDPKLRLDFDPALTVLYLGFNQAHAPWSNRDCRLAAALALNRERYVRDFFPGDAQLAWAMLPPGVATSPLPETAFRYDPAEAQRLWQACLDSGVGVPATMTLHVPPISRSYLPDPASLGAAVQADLATAGIHAQIVAPDWQVQWLPDVQHGRADLFLIGWVGVNGDPDSFLCPLFCGQQAAFNGDGQGNPLPPDEELAGLLQSAQATTDADERARLYEQAHARLWSEMITVPLAHRQTAWAYRANVSGNIPSPMENVFFNLTLGP
jgi:peptide/nickel transport system substrate-binding protein